jgi:hypothetical protein
MFSLRMEWVSAFLSRTFIYLKVSLFEGIVLGIMLIVFVMGSVSIFSIRDRRF